eukprot:GSChrysophyteH1.ASY1.ANO1.2777.1 assembled CDS
MYKPQFNGSGVSVFIVDTGLDTRHIEFANYRTNEDGKLEKQEVAMFPGPNNDMVGHGTHCAGTIGGNNVGVSPGADLYGVRVLSAKGSGADEDIILGLLYVYDIYLANDRPPSVINMSLGGSCESYEECSEDALVRAVEKLAEDGLPVVVAAGNSNCDACLETPAFASKAITVGAHSIKDEAAFFTDYGKCVDIYGPGVNITSACASIRCGGSHEKYTSLSGTSMAAPHAAGVAALTEAGLDNVQLDPVNTDTIVSELTCGAARGKLSLTRGEGKSPDKVTRNLLLQIPYVNVEDESDSLPDTLDESNCNLVCSFSSACDSYNSCSGHGLCQKGVCLCETGFWGASCESRERGFHCDAGMQYVPYTLYDLEGNAKDWMDSEFRMLGPHTRPTYNKKMTKWDQLSVLRANELSSNHSAHVAKHTVADSLPVVASSMCSGALEDSGVCLAVTVKNPQFDGFKTHFISDNETITTDKDNKGVFSYSLDVVPPSLTRGFSATWEMCGRKGGAPARWEILVFDPMEVANMSDTGTIHRNPNDNYGAAKEDDDWKSSEDYRFFLSNDTFCALQCVDKSPPIEINLYLQNPFKGDASSDMFVKSINIGSSILHDGSPEAGTTTISVGYTVMDVASGHQVGGGSWIMDREVVDFLSKYMMLYFEDSDLPAKKLELAALDAQFPIKQTQSFCVTTALLKAARLSIDSASSDNEVTIDLALITFGSASMRNSIAFEFCGIHRSFFTDFTVFRFIFSKNSDEEFDLVECHYVDPADRDVDSLQNLDATMQPEELKVGIFNPIADNFSFPATHGFNNADSEIEGNDWGWYTRSYTILPQKPVVKSDHTLHAYLDDRASLAPAANVFGQQQYPPHAAQSMYPLLTNASLYNDVSELPVTEWRMDITSKENEGTAPLGAQSFYLTCGMQAPTARTSYKFKTTRRPPSTTTDSMWTALINSSALPLSSVGTECERDCVSITASSLEGPLEMPLGDSVDPIMAVLGLNDSISSLAQSEKPLRGLIALTSRNRLCIGNATFSHQDDTMCTTLLLGGGTQSVTPLWDMTGCGPPSSTHGGSIKGYVTKDGQQLYPSAAILDICVSDWTRCAVSRVVVPDCSDAAMAAASAHTDLDTRDTQIYMYPSSRTSPFPPIMKDKDVNKDGVDDSTQDNIVVPNLKRFGFYLMLYGDKGGWAGSEYIIYKAGGLLKSLPFAAKDPLRNMTSDDDRVPLGSDDDPYIRQMNKETPFDLVTAGTLADNKKSDAHAICLSNGCYMLDVTRGNYNLAKENIFVMCGFIGSAGTGAFFGIHEGECTVYSAMLLCQVEQIYYELLNMLWDLGHFFLVVFLILMVLLAMLFRRKGYPATSQAQEYQVLPDFSDGPFPLTENHRQSLPNVESQFANYGSQYPSSNPFNEKTGPTGQMPSTVSPVHGQFSFQSALDADELEMDELSFSHNQPPGDAAATYSMDLEASMSNLRVAIHSDDTFGEASEI